MKSSTRRSRDALWFKTWEKTTGSDFVIKMWDFFSKDNNMNRINDITWNTTNDSIRNVIRDIK